MILPPACPVAEPEIPRAAALPMTLGEYMDSVPPARFGFSSAAKQRETILRKPRRA